MDRAGVLLKELKEVAKDVGVLEKSTKLRCARASRSARKPRCAHSARL
jgi:hypothetical protein